MEKDESFLRIHEPKNLTEWKKGQQWLHSMGMGQGIKTSQVW